MKCDVLWNVKIVQISANLVMMENRRTGIVLGQLCEDTLLVLPDKSKLPLVVFSNWYGEKKTLATSRITCQMPGSVLIGSSDGTTLTTAAFFPFLTVHSYFSISIQSLYRPNRGVQWEQNLCHHSFFFQGLDDSICLWNFPRDAILLLIYYLSMEKFQGFLLSPSYHNRSGVNVGDCPVSKYMH